MKIVIDIDELDRWNMVIDKVQNALNSGEDIEKIVVVASGRAIIPLVQGVNADLAQRLSILDELKVEIEACHNSLQKFNPTGNVPLKFVKVVPYGMLELVKRQNDGFAYIRP